MRWFGTSVLGLGVLLGLPSTAALAHHSFAAAYDYQQPLRITGVIAEVYWVNPHVTLIVGVTGRKGQVVTWEFLADAASSLTRRGVPSSVLKVGDAIRIDGFRARDGSNKGTAGAVRLPDGRRLFLGPLEDPTPISRIVAPAAPSASRS